jgi:hypothetical protein
MKTRRTRYYWITIALAFAAALLMAQAYAQSTGAAAVFEGRPAMAGAQAGQGALAGPPQGGIGVQGAEAGDRGLVLGRPSELDDDAQAGPVDRGTEGAATPGAVEGADRTTRREAGRADRGVHAVDGTAASTAR